MSISIKKFNNKVNGLEFVANVIKNSTNSNLEDGKFYFHFSIDGDFVVAEDSYRNAEHTVTACFDTDSVAFYEKIAKISGVTVTDFSDYIGNEDEWKNEFRDIIFRDFDMGYVEEHEEFAEDFKAVCEDLYDKILDIINE